MTATSACRIELEALRERLSAIINELRTAERMIEAFEVPETPSASSTAALVDAVCDMRDLKRTMAKRTVLSTGATPAPMAAAARPGTSDLSAEAARVLRVIELAGGVAVSRAEIGTPGRMSVDAVRVALAELVQAGRVRKRGQTSAVRYTLSTAPEPLRPGAVAGTQAAPPVGPPSAIGPPEFETVWNGTKERNGQAPSILPPRERKP